MENIIIYRWLCTENINIVFFLNVFTHVTKNDIINICAGALGFDEHARSIISE